MKRGAAIGIASGMLALGLLALVWLADVLGFFGASPRPLFGLASALSALVWALLCLALLVIALVVVIALLPALKPAPVAGEGEGWTDAQQDGWQEAPAAAQPAWQEAPAEAQPQAAWQPAADPTMPEQAAPAAQPAPVWSSSSGTGAAHRVMRLRCMNCQTVFEHDVQLQGDDVFSCPHCSRDGHVVSPH